MAADLVRQAFVVVLLVAGPLLAVAMIVGVIVSLIQAITQIQEQTLTFIPKLVLVGLAALVAMPWMLTRLTTYLVGMLRSLPGLGG
jgi:flagellar biosynthetic protein FliQ